MVFEVVQRRRVEALDLRFSASHQIIRSHVPILQPARCLSCCVLFRVRSSMRWRIHQKGSMFWTRHSTLPLDFSRNDQLLDTNYNTNYWGSQDHLKLFHIALLGWNLNPIILLFLRSQLTKMLHFWLKEPTITHTCKIPNPGRPEQNVSRIALIVVFWLRAVTLCHQNLNDIGEPPSKIPMNGILEMVLDLGNAIRREELPQMTQNLSRELWKHQILVGFNSTRGSLMFEYSCWKAMMIIRIEHDYIMIIMIMTWWLWFCGFAIVCQSEANMP